ncbi:hypothetical protein D8674_042695 [Pyrus ussuriensis x Pyrus communis]|uniref:Uncharacterized protein n=1 Tax=Pyrus ussuriensis x Pyrus communis TaxID=2448454 RepID=A0A5N5HNE5_9ROSA|nr:hypothetical protein D8674_042695 [Pyrus ussuriensis x Pyrus communis]
MAPRRARSAIVEFSDSELEGRPQPKLDPFAPRATPTKKRTLKKLDSSPNEMKAGVEGQQNDKEIFAKILEKLNDLYYSAVVGGIMPNHRGSDNGGNCSDPKAGGITLCSKG